MDYPVVEVLQDNNATVFSMTSYGEQLSELRCQQLKSQNDNKRPDGTTLLPWARVKRMAWDVTVPDT